MHVLLIGSGGREHALAWKIAQSPLVTRLSCAPGNAGIAQVAQIVALDVTDHAAVIAFCKAEAVAFVVVGPEVPLVAGLVDDLAAAGISAFGPRKFAAQLEGSKGFTKDICAKYGIPTAAYGRFTDAIAARAYVEKQGAPIVIKADGLAAGKGVVVAMTLAEALGAIDMMFDGGMGDAGAEVVIEEFLDGEEASFFVLTDGRSALPFGTAQDHKRVGEGDTGPNTGGMGAYSPAPVLSDALIARTMAEIIEPTIRALADMGCPFTGVLYAGLMLTKGGPKLIEYNCRFGDPECQVLMPRLASDIVPILMATANGTLERVKAVWRAETALTVVMAAKGYPGAVEKGSIINGLEAAGALVGVTVFHAGTRAVNGAVTANGGRVLNVTALGATVGEAQALAYAAVDSLDWPQGFCRRDIGWRAVEREKSGA